MNPWVELLGGGVLLYFGAEWFVGGASALALSLRVPQLLIGLTVVAYGTSAPEIVVGVEAALAGHADVALGNVVGSNIANFGLILGVAALIRPARVDGALRSRELPVLLVSTLLVPVFLLDSAISRVEARLLCLAAVAYTLWMIRAARDGASATKARENAVAAEEAADLAGSPAFKSATRSALTAVFGLVVLLLGGRLFVDGAVSISHILGMSERLVGLTIVALGTSLPELMTSIIAARRGHSDLAVGNVVGSNIFNILLCLGAAGLASNVGAPLSSLYLDIGALLLMTLMGVVFMRSARTMTRLEGGICLAAYLVFIGITVARG